MSHFEDVFYNDVEYLKHQKQIDKALHENEKNYLQQKEIVERGNPQPMLNYGPYWPNTRQAVEKLREGFESIEIDIKEKERGFTFKRADQLKHHDPEGHAKWEKKQKFLIQRERALENKRSMDKFRDRGRDR